MSKANDYEIREVSWEGRPDVVGPAVFRKADGAKVVAAWVPGTRISLGTGVSGTNYHGPVAYIEPPHGDPATFYLDA